MRVFHFFAAMMVIVLLTACSLPKLSIFSDKKEPLREFTLSGNGENKVLLISVNGMITDVPDKGLIRTTPSVVEQVVSQLNKAAKDSRIKTILFQINSAGGTITASDLLYHEILSFKERTGKKVAVCMMDLAASGAYYMSLPADEIIAHPTTVTGSVGVIFLQPKVYGLMDKIGLGVDVKKFGKNKDMGSPFREGTEEEQKLMQKMVNDFGDRFLQLVQKHRKLDQKSVAEVSTARVFTADEALTLGLIDKIGYLADAVNEAKKIAAITDDARVVVYRRVEFPEDNYYNAAGVTTDGAGVPLVNIELPDILKFKTGFYYLWPGAVSF
jgi:protease-4